MRRQQWRYLMTNAAGDDLAQYEALHKLPMTEVLFKVERWFNSIFAAQQQTKKLRKLDGRGRSNRVSPRN
jgi:hypothetical protein